MTAMTLLQMIDDKSATASEAASQRRDECKSRQEANAVDMKSYRMGEAIGLLDARKLVKAELLRLCNRFQNGQLSVSDFGVDL